jgi:hypothetical protein
MAEDESLGESVMDSAEILAAPAEGAPEPRPVSASVTYTRADARAMLLMGVPRRTLLISKATAVILLLLVALNLAKGDPPPWTAFGWLGLFVCVFVLFLHLLPRQIAKASPSGQSWTISPQGLHVTLPGTDVTHEWCRIDEIVLRPALIQFRIGKCSLTLPRRCLGESDTEAIEVLATGAKVAVRKRGWLR